MNATQWRWIKRRARELLVHHQMPSDVNTRREAVATAADAWCWMRRDK